MFDELIPKKQPGELEKSEQERRRIEEALRLDERRLNYSLLVGDIGAWELNLTTGNAWRSLCHDQIFGYDTPLPKWTYDMFLNHVLPEDRQEVDRKFREAISKATEWNFECRIVRKDGVTRWITSQGKPVEYNLQNAPVIMIGIVRDITDRKKMETELSNFRNQLDLLVKARTDELRLEVVGKNKASEECRTNEERFSQVSEISGDWVWEVDRHGMYTYSNAVAESILGFKAEELVGNKYFYDFFPPASKEELKTSIFENFTNKTVFKNIITEVTNKNGSIVTLQTSGLPILNDEEELVAFRGVNVDITVRKATETMLEASEANCRAVFEMASDAIFIQDIGTYQVMDVNEAACEMFACPKTKIVGLNLKAIISEGPHCKLEDIVKNYDKAAGGEPQLFEWSIKDREGRTFWVETSLRRAVMANAYSLLAITRNISTRREAANKIIELNDTLTKANENLKKLALKDAHTGLYNYNYFNEAIEMEFARAKRQSTPLSVIMVDIDHFKEVNYVHGHEFGDIVLKQFAEEMKKAFRRYDLTIRFSGDDFIIISPDTNKRQALAIAKRFVKNVGTCDFGNEKGSVKIKTSAAISSYPEDRITSTTDFINIAEKTLDAIKRDGGSGVYSSEEMEKGRKSGKQREDKEIKSLVNKISELASRANQGLTESMIVFAKSVGARYNYAPERVDRIVLHAVKIAEETGMAADEIEDIKNGAVLHDLGKIGISEKVLLKTEGRTKKEAEEFEKHPQIGADIIRPMNIFRGVVPIVLHHHEWWNGKGYPAGLKEKEIPIGARIVLVADAYEDFVYGEPSQAHTKEEAMEMIKKGVGLQFDPAVVDTFLEILKNEK